MKKFILVFTVFISFAAFYIIGLANAENTQSEDIIYWVEGNDYENNIPMTSNNSATPIEFEPLPEDPGVEVAPVPENGNIFNENKSVEKENIIILQ